MKPVYYYEFDDLRKAHNRLAAVTEQLVRLVEQNRGMLVRQALRQDALEQLALAGASKAARKWYHKRLAELDGGGS